MVIISLVTHVIAISIVEVLLKNDFYIHMKRITTLLLLFSHIVSPDKLICNTRHTE